LDSPELCRESRIGRTAVFAGWLQAEEMERQHADALKAAQAARFVVTSLSIWIIVMVAFVRL
jgi:hypothetical protein